VRATYRPDLYRLALAPLGVELPLQDSKIEGQGMQARDLASIGGSLQYGPDGFFDDKTFDPEMLNDYQAEPETSPELGRTANSMTI
jgi:NitT/TauT family transport system ATP-binding protein